MNNENIHNEILKQSFNEEFIYGVGIPVVNSEHLDYLVVFVKKLDSWVGTPGIPHLESWILTHPVTLDEG